MIMLDIMMPVLGGLKTCRQIHDNVSDREAQERAQYDLRWKVALRLPMNEAGFDYTSLCRFRARLLINKQQKLIFERFLHLAKEAGIVKDGGLQIIDSSHISRVQTIRLYS